MWKLTCICIIYNFIIYLFIFFSDEKIQGNVSLILVFAVSFVSSPEQECFFFEFYNTVESFIFKNFKINTRTVVQVNDVAYSPLVLVLVLLFVFLTIGFAYLVHLEIKKCTVQLS